MKARQKRNGWGTLFFVAILMACALLTGCSGEGKIGAPFDDYECKGKDVAQITALLEEAGFTNIQTEAQDTTWESSADNVISVKIGSSTYWNEANTWKPDTQVTIEYYNYTGIRHIEVTANITVSGEDGKPVFTVQTNLPDGTVLSAELSYDGDITAGQEDYIETQEITVQGGVAQTEAYTKDGEPLEGNYLFGILMLPTDQAESVQEVTGTAGEALKGKLVENAGGYQYIATSIEYESPIEEIKPEIEKISEEELETRFSEALIGFGENCNVSCEGYLYTVQIWQDGLAETAVMAIAGDEQSVNTWNEIKDITIQGADSLQELLALSGYDDYLVQVQLLNDQNLENILLTSCLGTVTYDCVAEG